MNIRDIQRSGPGTYWSHA